MFGKDTVKDIDDFRSKVREMIAAGFVPDSDYRFMLDSRTYFMEKVGKLDFADDLLKRIIERQTARRMNRIVSIPILDAALRS